MFIQGSRNLGDQVILGQIGRGGDNFRRAGMQEDFVSDRGGGENHLEVVFALQAFLDDLHMEQAQETGPETETERL